MERAKASGERQTHEVRALRLEMAALKRAEQEAQRVLVSMDRRLMDAEAERNALLKMNSGMMDAPLTALIHAPRPPHSFVRISVSQHHTGSLLRQMPHRPPLVPVVLSAL